MRRFLLVILTALSMLACCSCSSSVSLKNPSENSADQGEYNKKAAAAKAWEECDKSEMQTFTGESRGIAFTVSTDKREYAVNETVRVKAEVQNVSGGELYNVYLSLGECYPIEILLDIDCGSPSLYNKKNTGTTQRRSYLVPMKPGEVYEDYISFEANCVYHPTVPGEYKGRCYVYTVPDPDHNNAWAMHSIDFSITLTGYENSEIEKILYDLEHRKSAEDLWEECDKSEMQTFTGEDGGIAFTVLTDKREYTIGETIKVKAKMQNNTDSDIYLPSGGQILPKLDNPHDGETLYTGWLEGYCVLDCENSFQLSPGEVYEHCSVFETHYYKGGTAEPGEYNGICNFYTVPYSILNGEQINHSVDFSITLTGDNIYSKPEESDAEVWETCEKSEMQNFTGEDGGIALTVTTDKREYTVGEPIRVKAEAQNITDGGLWYVCGNSIENYPIEMHINILGDGRYFKSDRSEIRTSEMVYFSMTPGELYDDYVTFETGYFNGEPAKPGVYNGTCYIYTVPDKDYDGESTEHSVDFSITLKQSGQIP